MAKSKAEKRLEELLMDVHRCGQAVSEAERNQRPSEIPKRALRLAYALVQSHCEKHGLPLPMDIPED